MGRDHSIAIGMNRGEQGLHWPRDAQAPEFRHDASQEIEERARQNRASCLETRVKSAAAL
jgi:hypothetical protein